MPTLSVNGRRVEVDPDATILDAARVAGVEVPTLCQFDGLEPWGGCRLCVVEMSQANWDDDWFKMVTACNHPVEDGMTVVTDSERVIETRRVVLDLLLARCPETPLIQKIGQGARDRRDLVHSEPRAQPTAFSAVSAPGSATTSVFRRSRASIVAGDARLHRPSTSRRPIASVAWRAPRSARLICIPFETSNHRRTIWGKEFEMLRDPKTGQAVITKAQAEHFSERSGVPDFVLREIGCQQTSGDGRDLRELAGGEE